MTTAKIPEELDDAHAVPGPLPEDPPESDKRNGIVQPEGGPWGQDGSTTTAERQATPAPEPEKDDTVGTQGGPWGQDGHPTQTNGGTSTSPEKGGDGAVTPTWDPDGEPTPSRRSA